MNWFFSRKVYSGSDELLIQKVLPSITTKELLESLANIAKLARECRSEGVHSIKAFDGEVQVSKLTKGFYVDFLFMGFFCYYSIFLEC